MPYTSRAVEQVEGDDAEPTKVVHADVEEADVLQRGAVTLLLMPCGQPCCLHSSMHLLARFLGGLGRAALYMEPSPAYEVCAYAYLHFYSNTVLLCVWVTRFL